LGLVLPCRPPWLPYQRPEQHGLQHLQASLRPRSDAANHLPRPPTLHISDTEGWNANVASEHLLQTADTLAQVQASALKNLEKAQARNKAYFDKRHRTFEEAPNKSYDKGSIDIGDYVVVRAAKWSKVHSEADVGAYKVHSFKGKTTVVVEDATGFLFGYHRNNVKLHARKRDVDEDALKTLVTG
jgi:hypothetical protein